MTCEELRSKLIETHPGTEVTIQIPSAHPDSEYEIVSCVNCVITAKKKKPETHS